VAGAPQQKLSRVINFGKKYEYIPCSYNPNLLISKFCLYEPTIFKIAICNWTVFLSTVLSVFVISSKLWLNIPLQEIKTYIELANIEKIVLNYLLGFLLFAGALHTNWNNLRQQIRPIATFALGGVLLSTIIIAALFYSLTQIFNLDISFIYCLIFGALISPTDPIAVLGILTKANVPKKTEYTIVGESLVSVHTVAGLACLRTPRQPTKDIFCNFSACDYFLASL
jgi:CPA1 family monovalent cation:H+ antiporter